MPKAVPHFSHFSTGEISKLISGRTDIETYPGSLFTCLNAIVLPQGPWLERSGSKYVAGVKTSSKATRLYRFEFSTTQAYIIEFGDQYIRAYKDRAQILDGGPPFELSTSYLEADLFKLKFTQSADVLYITHEDYAPAKLTRTSHTAWTLTDISFKDGPYLPTNVTATTLTRAGTTVTASAVTGINNDTGFQTTDVGRHIRAHDGTNWVWMEITSRTSTTVVEVDVSGTITATADWRLGIWSDTTNYPRAVTFYEDRLGFGGCPENPARVDLSRTGDYETFSPTEPDGTVLADSAISFTLNSSDVQNIRWIVGGDKALHIGAVSGEWTARPSEQGEAMSPSSNIPTAKESGNNGCADIAAIKVDNEVIFVQRALRKVYRQMYSLDKSGFLSEDLNQFAAHIAKVGVIEMAYQKQPYPIIWCVLADGSLASMTYRPSPGVPAWHRHILGGVSDAAGSAAKIESVAVIPSPDGSVDDVWVVVQRYINGATVRYVEHLMPFWEEGDDITDAYYVDCGITYDGAATTTITGLGHLEGETVSVLGDGSPRPDATVSGGQITLAKSASKVHVGYGYNADGETVNVEAGAADGTSQGRTKRIDYLTLRLFETVGLQFGPDANTLDKLEFRNDSDPGGAAIPPFTGDKHGDFPGDYETNGRVYWRQPQPLPACVLSVIPHLRTSRGR